ncbi:MAG TPA: hypothetical protein PLV13_09490 [Ilumatobacteraceae bacterium]|nr:hypothetical protein [Ilumatobacteraceae bacterium]
MAALAGLSACADGGAEAEQPPTTSAAVTSTSAATTAPTTTVGPGPTLAADELLTMVAASYAQVYANGAYNSEFVEHADDHAATLQAFRSNPRAADLQVVVTSAAYLDDDACATAGVTDPCIETHWDLLFDGVLTVPDNTGYAVWSDGRWKVSERTFCSLAILSDPTISDC